MNKNCLGPLMLDLEGLTVSDKEKEVLRSPVVGGLILFSRNFNSVAQLKSLIEEIRRISPEILIAVDHEGGRVQRFREGFTRIPSMAAIGQVYSSNPEKGIKLAREAGWLMASELIAFDIDISFAPVLDIDYGESTVIGDRAFSSDPDEIIALTSAFIAGMKDAGMASTGKHYPGHGAVAADSHIDIPVDERDLQEIESSDFRVFKALCEVGMDAVMPAHVIYPKICAHPAGFSRIWLQELLRKKLSFDGVIFSDDLGMEGATVAGNFRDRTDAALSAGCDMVLVCNKPEAAIEVRDHLETLVLPDNYRLSKMRLDKNKQLSWDELTQTDRWKNVNKQLSLMVSKNENEQLQVGE